MRDLEVVVLIEDRGTANGTRSELLATAGFTLMQARLACSNGRVEEGCAL